MESPGHEVPQPVSASPASPLQEMIKKMVCLFIVNGLQQLACRLQY
jgi:hypothetical protein